MVQLAVGKDCVLGVRKDGTVLRWGGERSGLQQVDRWKDIRQILITDPASGDIEEVAAFGLRKDGTVVSTSRGVSSLREEVNFVVFPPLFSMVFGSFPSAHRSWIYFFYCNIP